MEYESSGGTYLARSKGASTVSGADLTHKQLQGNQDIIG